MAVESSTQADGEPVAASRITKSGARETSPGATNEVVLRGRLSTEPTVRELPSGASIVTFRVVVPRAETVMTRGSRQKSDWVECAAWSSIARRRAVTWHVGDTVEVAGALRRRHYGGASVGSALDVEMLSGRLVTRAEAASAGPAREKRPSRVTVRGSPGAGTQ